MRSRQSETWLLLPLLPIMVFGSLPLLLFALLGFAGVVLLGILMICVGLSDALNANSDFSQQVIVRGYAGGSERTIDAKNRHSAIRFSFFVGASGVGLAIGGLCGFFYFT